MKILTIDTSFSLASIAITAEGKLLAETVFNADKRLSAILVPEITHLLSLSKLTCNDIDLFGCSIGPGSFTGVRGGVATIQGLALAAGKPCVGYSTLALLAMNFPLVTSPVCTVVDARKGEVYAAMFDVSSGIPVELIEECVLPLEKLLDDLPENAGSIIFTGDGLVRYQEQIENRLGPRALIASLSYRTPGASKGALLALDLHDKGKMIEAAQLQPVYLRPADAEYAKISEQPSKKF